MNNKPLTRDQFLMLPPGSIIVNQLTGFEYKTVYVKLCARTEMEVLWADAINVSTKERVKVTYHRHWLLKSVGIVKQVAA